MSHIVFSDQPTFSQDYILAEETWSQNAGPFLWNTTSFGVFVDTLTNHIEVWAHGGNWTNPTEQDAGNKPACAVSTANYTSIGYGWESCDAIQHPTLPELYICYLDSDDKITIRVFYMNTGLWGETLSGGPDLTQHRPAFDDDPQAYVNLTYRLVNDDFKVAYLSEIVAHRKLITCTRAGAWGTPLDLGQIAGGARFGWVTLHSTGMTHMFGGLGGAGFTDQHRSLSASDVLGTGQIVFTPLGLGPFSIGRPIANQTTGEIICPAWEYDSTQPFGFRAGRILVARAPSSANPAWTIQTVLDSNSSKLQVQLGFLGSAAIFFNVTVPNAVNGFIRQAPEWDLPQHIWYSQVVPSGITVAGTLFAVWRTLGVGFLDPNNPNQYGENQQGEQIYVQTYTAIGGWGNPELLVPFSDIAGEFPEHGNPRLFRISVGTVTGQLAGNLNSILGASRSPKIG